MSIVRSAGKSIALTIPAVRRLYRELLSANDKLATLRRENAALTGETVKLSQTLDGASADNARLSKALNLRHDEIGTLNSELDARGAELGALRGKLDAADSEINGLRAQLNARNAEAAVLHEESRAEATALRNQLDSRDARIAKMREEFVELERTNRDIHRMLVARNAENAYLQAELLSVKGDPSSRLLPGFEWCFRGLDWSRESAPTPFWADRIATVRADRLREGASRTNPQDAGGVTDAISTYEFSEDSFTQHVRNWELVFRECVIDAKKILEVGSYEGRSTVWLVEHGFNPERGGDLYCVDTWLGSAEHFAPAMPDVEARFDRNVAVARQRSSRVDVHKIKGDSATSLVRLLVDGHAGSFDFIYVDANHMAANVLTDLVLAFALSRVGGIIVCDDYLWGNPLHGPKMAIDAFTNCFFGMIEPLPGLLLYQIFLRKLADGPVPHFQNVLAKGSDEPVEST